MNDPRSWHARWICCACGNRVEIHWSTMKPSVTHAGQFEGSCQTCFAVYTPLRQPPARFLRKLRGAAIQNAQLAKVHYPKELRELLAEVTRMLSESNGVRTDELREFIKAHAKSVPEFKELAFTLILLAEGGVGRGA